MGIFLFIFFLVFASLGRSQSEFNNFINFVNLLNDSAAKSVAADSFMNYAEQKGIPFIENNTAAFIYRGKISSVNIAGDFTSWKPNISMQRLDGTNFFYYSKKFEPNARLDYKLILNNKNWILDPNNPEKIQGGFGQNSELAMPDYIQPWEIKFKPEIDHGKVISKSIRSKNLDSTFQLKIYLPSEYDSVSNKEYPTVYFQDGFDYINLATAVNVIDNLIDSNEIEPLIAVFVQPNKRNEEYGFAKRNEYVLFFINELVPYIDNNFRTLRSPSQRLVMGCSLGGNISALISYKHSDIFVKCGLHSAALWPNDNEVYNLIVNGDKKNIKFASIWGTYESLNTMLQNFKNNLIAKGYEINWLSLPEGHSWGLWRANIDRFLIYFFPSKEKGKK